MTSDEFAEILEELEDAWPGTRAYTNAERSYPKFAAYPADYLRAAADQLFEEGRQSAPSLSTLAKATKQAAARAWEAGVARAPLVDACATDGHLWAIVEWERQSTDGLRHAVCARPGCEATRAGDRETLPTNFEFDPTLIDRTLT